MYTLKIRWTRHVTKPADASSGGDKSTFSARITSLEDETTLFIPADQVRVHSMIPVGERADQMKHWDHQIDGPGYFNYLSVVADEDGPDVEQGGRLICVVKDGVETWYVASLAWVLGADGATIERVAP